MRCVTDSFETLFLRLTGVPFQIEIKKLEQLIKVRDWLFPSLVFLRLTDLPFQIEDLRQRLRSLRSGNLQLEERGMVSQLFGKGVR